MHLTLNNILFFLVYRRSVKKYLKEWQKVISRNIGLKTLPPIKLTRMPIEIFGYYSHTYGHIGINSAIVSIVNDQMLITLAHEMMHAKQVEDGRMRIQNNNIIIFDNWPWPLDTHTHDQYITQPWEKEATQYELDFYKNFKLTASSHI